MRFLSNSILPYSEKHGLLPLILIFIFLSPPLCTAQSNTDVSNNNFYGGAQFSPSMAVIILVLIASLLFMVFLSIFIRNCANLDSNRSIRPSAIGGERSERGARGIDASVIDTFPTMVYSEVKDHKIGKNALECAVCLSEFEDNETLRLLPICDHVFHPECIDEWLGSHTTCPVCRVNLSPQLDDLVSQPIEFSTVEPDIEAQHDAVVSEPEDEHEERPLADEAQSVGEVNDANRKRGSRSGRTRKFPRSHSTGHSLVQPGENMDRFTLRLPVEVRKQMVNRQLNRATSLLILPREGSSRRGYRRTSGEGSSRGRYSRRIEKLDRFGKSDRWVYGRTPSFFSRASMKSPKVVTNRGEEAPGPVADSVRPPV